MLTENFLAPELLSWTKTTGLYTQIESILESVQKNYYDAEKASKMILALIEFELEKTALNPMTFEHFKDLLEVGDYAQVYGQLEYSKSGEPSLFAQEYKILTKALRPLPEKMDYENTESRYLDKVADYKMNTKDEDGLSVRDLVRVKAKYWSIWRDEMQKEGFLEVECPIFEGTPGGAEAKPFTTFYNELDQEMYLRISLELPLKKLIAGGFEKVYEIGRIFRNEGSSPQHLQEYTQIEWYCAYQDYDWAAAFVKRVYQRVVLEVLEKMIQTDYNGNSINWGEWCTRQEAVKNGWELVGSDGETNPEMGWPKIGYFDAVRHFSNGLIDTENKTEDELCELGKEFGLEMTPELGLATLLDKLWKKARINTHNPFFLCLPPVALEPLAKRDPKNPELTQRWQVVAGGAELGKAFSELNDPIDQFGRFEDQQKARDNGNEEAQFMDTNYVKAMEYGMPPMAGFGTSERFVSFLLGKHIRECVTFPHIRENQNNTEIKNIQVVLLDQPNIPLWSKLNTTSHLSASISARNKYQILGEDKVKSADGKDITLSIPHPIVIRETNSQQDLKKIIEEAKKLGLAISEFTVDNRDGKSQQDDIVRMNAKTFDEIEFLGVAIFGDKKKTEKLTKQFPLFGQGDSNDVQNPPNLPTRKVSERTEGIFTQPQTELLSLENTYLFNCSAKVLETGEMDGKEFVILDRTIFYPQGGGQPSDTGVILTETTGFAVSKCQIIEDKCYHFGEYVSGELNTGDTVEVDIDAKKRRLNARVHTAGHLLTEALHNIGINLNSIKGYHFPEGPYVEYSGKIESSPELIKNFEKELMRLISANSKISYSLDFETISHGQPQRTLHIENQTDRLCGGTHVQNLSEIGSIKIRKIKNNTSKGTVQIGYSVE
jgi:lysyl-tRNA synthetase, class II